MRFFSALLILPYNGGKINPFFLTPGAYCGSRTILSRDVLRDLHVVAGLHGVLAAALGAGAQIGGIAEHLGQGHVGVDLLGAGTGLQPWMIWPRRLFRSPMTSPIYSSGTMTLTFMMGSSSVGSALRQASLKAMEPAILNAISEESTS